VAESDTRLLPKSFSIWSATVHAVKTSLKYLGLILRTMECSNQPTHGKELLSALGHALRGLA
jgi:hypothetical protein